MSQNLLEPDLLLPLPSQSDNSLAGSKSPLESSSSSKTIDYTVFADSTKIPTPSATSIPRFEDSNSQRQPPILSASSSPQYSMSPSSSASKLLEKPIPSNNSQFAPSGSAIDFFNFQPQQASKVVTPPSNVGSVSNVSVPPVMSATPPPQNILLNDQVDPKNVQLSNVNSDLNNSNQLRPNSSIDIKFDNINSINNNLGNQQGNIQSSALENQSRNQQFTRQHGKNAATPSTPITDIRSPQVKAPSQPSSLQSSSTPTGSPAQSSHPPHFQIWQPPSTQINNSPSVSLSSSSSVASSNASAASSSPSAQQQHHQMEHTKYSVATMQLPPPTIEQESVTLMKDMLKTMNDMNRKMLFMEERIAELEMQKDQLARTVNKLQESQHQHAIRQQQPQQMQPIPPVGYPPGYSSISTYNPRYAPTGYPPPM